MQRVNYIIHCSLLIITERGKKNQRNKSKHYWTRVKSENNKLKDDTKNVRGSFKGPNCMKLKLFLMSKTIRVGLN